VKNCGKNLKPRLLRDMMEIAMTIRLCFLVILVLISIKNLVIGQSTNVDGVGACLDLKTKSGKEKLTDLAPLPNWKFLENYQYSLTRQEFTKAMQKIYLGTSINVPWSVSLDRVDIKTDRQDVENVRLFFQDSEENKLKDKSWKIRYWKKREELTVAPLHQPLLGVHVALDPGHIGGDFAKMEERFLQVTGDQGYVAEGELTLLTAKILENKLKELGAVVSLVRNNNQPVNPFHVIDFVPFAKEKLIKEMGVTELVEDYNGMIGDQKMFTVRWQSEKLFYRVGEIRARADLINLKIKPDVVICLHFNAEEWGNPQEPRWVKENHLHVLIPGFYGKQELEYQDQRFEMMMRLFSKCHEVELPLAVELAKALKKWTQLPAYQYPEGKALPLAESEYLYARNLLANRLYQCPVIFLEPYVMNHRQTYELLKLGHFLGRKKVGDQMEGSLVEKYAMGVAEGLVKYYQFQRTIK
jgi:N-acetylmuramoyl-L-alanine amidase